MAGVLPALKKERDIKGAIVPRLFDFLLLLLTLGLLRLLENGRGGPGGFINIYKPYLLSSSVFLGIMHRDVKRVFVVPHNAIDVEYLQPAHKKR